MVAETHMAITSVPRLGMTIQRVSKPPTTETVGQATRLTFPATITVMPQREGSDVLDITTGTNTDSEQGG